MIKYYNGQIVSMSEANDSTLGNKYLAWIFVSVVTIFLVSLVLPFPISFIVSIIVLLTLSVIRADIAMKKSGMSGVKGWFRFFRSSDSGWRGTGTLMDQIKYSCINCGKEHNKTSCPKCGSKAVRAGR